MRLISRPNWSAMLVGLLAIAMFGPRSSHAQVLYGSMVGHVKDSSEESADKAVRYPGFAADLANQPYFVVRRA
jgi:hypothetical protein